MASSHRALAFAAALVLAACAGPDAPGQLTMSFPPAAMEPDAAWEHLADLPWPQDGQHTYKSYDDARRIFWRKMYPNGGTELYCGVDFDGRAQNAGRPGDVRRTHLPRRRDRRERARLHRPHLCRPRVQRAMADLHNLWPALGRVNSSRSRLRYGVIAGEDRPPLHRILPRLRTHRGRKGHRRAARRRERRYRALARLHALCLRPGRSKTRSATRDLCSAGCKPIRRTRKKCAVTP